MIDYKHRNTLLTLPYLQQHKDGTSINAILQHSGALPRPLRAGAGRTAGGAGTGGAGAARPMKLIGHKNIGTNAKLTVN